MVHFFVCSNDAVVDGTNDKLKGIPDFWLTILKNTSLISDMIQSHDEPILSHLTDIKVYLLEEPMVYLFGSTQFFMVFIDFFF